MVLTLVLLPPLADILKGTSDSSDWTSVGLPLLVTFGKVIAFVAFMLIVGRRVIPWLLHYVAHTGSRELFRLAVLAISLGVAFGAATLFDVSFALGAFFAGMILSESELSHRAAQETLPLRDAFAVLFFVSVGMLVDPMIAIRDPLPLIATVFIIILGKSFAAFLIVRMFGHPRTTALTISASLAQIGEFSFILVTLGVSLALLPERGRDLVLAGAIVSILINPVLFVLLDRFSSRAERRRPKFKRRETVPPPPPREPLPISTKTDHVVLVGYGRVGSVVGKTLLEDATPLIVIEDRPAGLKELRERGVEVLQGNAVAQGMLQAANIGAARALLVAIPDAFEGGQIVAKARAISAELPIIARAHSEQEIAHLRHHGANVVIMGEQEIAKAMIAKMA
jgi:CPA2 family monovalent cation:H+ antiporter-2